MSPDRDPPVNNPDVNPRLLLLAADPTYPNSEIIRSLAEKLFDLFRYE
ncbi:MAG TPA: hypothetical protein VGD78_02610 [Chthoniobacterales bacterium]